MPSKVNYLRGKPRFLDSRAKWSRSLRRFTGRNGDGVVHGDDEAVRTTEGAEQKVGKIFDVVERSEDAGTDSLKSRKLGFLFVSRRNESKRYH